MFHDIESKSSFQWLKVSFSLVGPYILPWGRLNIAFVPNVHVLVPGTCECHKRLADGIKDLEMGEIILDFGGGSYMQPQGSS